LSRDVTGRDRSKNVRLMVQVLTKRGEKISRSRRSKAGYCSLKTDLAQQFKRSRSTLDRWILLAIRGNEDFASAYIFQYEKYGQRAPLHPYQTFVLTAINKFQRRERDPKKLRTDREIIDFCSQFSLTQFLESIQYQR
jgi:hypothetical protein